MSDEEIRARLKSSVLDDNRPMLCKNLEPKLHYPYLRSKYVLSRDDEEVIESEPTTKQKVHKFLDILMMKGVRGYDELVRSIIQEKTQIFVAKQLNQAYEEKLKRLQALVASSGQVENSCAPVTSTVENFSSKQNSKLTRTLDLPILLPSVNTISSSVSCDLWNSPSPNIEVDTENLPIPVMQKKVPDIEELRTSRKESCENSFEEDLEDNKSVTDSIVSEGESKA